MRQIRTRAPGKRDGACSLQQVQRSFAVGQLRRRDAIARPSQVAIQRHADDQRDESAKDQPGLGRQRRREAQFHRQAGHAAHESEQRRMPPSAKAADQHGDAEREQ